mmetsp:Transcript_3039/g.5099  ORF Transcript_3039/g.5099 Transcript_3039/m.5099 type:complete len:315 (-) Transcript_3039:711-1655(-)
MGGKDHQAFQNSFLYLRVLLGTSTQSKNRIGHERHLIVSQVCLQLLQKLRNLILLDDLCQDIQLETLHMQRVTCPDEKSCEVRGKDSWVFICESRHVVENDILGRRSCRSHAEHQSLGTPVVLVRWSEVKLQGSHSHDHCRISRLEKWPGVSQKQPVIICYHLLGIFPCIRALCCCLLLLLLLRFRGPSPNPVEIVNRFLHGASHRSLFARVLVVTSTSLHFLSRLPVRIDKVCSSIPMQKVDRSDLRPLVHVCDQLTDLSKAPVDNLQPVRRNEVEHLARSAKHCWGGLAVENLEQDLKKVVFHVPVERMQLG